VGAIMLAFPALAAYDGSSDRAPAPAPEPAGA